MSGLNVFADGTSTTTSDPTAVATTFANKMVEGAEGPITKFLAAAILLTGVSGLLRGRHRLAVSCGVAFIVLLSLPLLIPH